MGPSTPADIINLPDEEEDSSVEPNEVKFPVMLIILGVFILIKISIGIWYMTYKSYKKIRNCIRRADESLAQNRVTEVRGIQQPA